MLNEPDLRNQANLIKAEGHAQFDKTHGAATLRSGPLSTTPAEDLNNYDGTHRPIIGVRVFHGGAQQVVNDIAYYFCYGFMRCNLSQDAHLEEGIYAYVDIETAISKLDYNVPTDRSKCIGIVEGYLSKRHEDKISLNPRSTKLIAVSSPWDTEIHLPFTLGAEDALAFRLPPHQLGAPVRWFRQLSNIDGKTLSKAAIRTNINSGEWPTPLSNDILDRCCEIAQYNSQSRNYEDIIEQKNLWIKMFGASGLRR